MAITQENIAEGKIKINGSIYSLVEIVHGGTGTVIWPSGYTYVLEDVAIHYSTGNQILASGDNYAWVTATVKKYRGGSLIETTTNVTVTPTLTSGQHFYVSGNYIYGHDLETNEVLNGYSDSVTATFSTASASAGTIYQQYNVKGNPVSIDVSVSCVPDKDSGIDMAGETVDVYAYISRTLHYIWTSGSPDTSTDVSGSMYMYVDGTFVGSMTNGDYYSVVFSSNHTTSTVTKTVMLYYASDQSVYDSAEMEQEAGVVTYNIPVIDSYDCEDVPAGGGTVYPTGYGHQSYYWNGDPSDSGVINFIPLTWVTSSFSGNDLGTNLTPRTKLGTAEGYCQSNGKTSASVYQDVYQEENKIEFTTYDGRSEKQYGQPYVDHEEYQNPFVSLSVQNYGSSSSPCPASGGTTNLIIVATVQERDCIATPWTIYDYYTDAYTSQSEEHRSVVYQSDRDVSYTSWDTVPVTPTLSGSGEGFGLDTDTGEITISNRSNVAGSLRSATFTATYSITGATASDSVTAYQEANVAYPQYEPIHSLDIQHTGDFPASGGTYTVNYVARQETWTEYTSGYETQHTISSETIAVDGFYCTPSVNTISGTGSFTINVEQNRTGVDREVTVTAGDASDSRTQEA